MDSMLLQFFETIEKSMQKGKPTVDFLDPFADMERTGVDCVCFFNRFGAMPNNHVFF